jgi:two-component system chemotaxis response regulator CheB
MPQNAINYAQPAKILSADEIASYLIEIMAKPFETAALARETHLSKKLDDEIRDADLQDEGRKPQHGIPSAFACPECHGVLWELKDGELLRFRCRVGHAYTADALRVALSESTEESLWAAMRVMEEKIALLRRMAPRSGPNLGKKYSEEAEGYDKHVRIIRQMLMENQETEENPKKDVA